MFFSPNCKKWTTYGVSGAFFVLGLALVLGWKPLINNILHNELSLSSRHTQGYDIWTNPPVTIYMKFFMFNWTNAEEYVANPKSVKPKFEQFGPYSFTEEHFRENVTINKNNDTVTFYTKKIWKFAPDLTNGSLDDEIVTLNPVLATIASIVQWKHILVRKGVSFLLDENKEKLFVRKTVRELLFDGYDDPMLDLMRKLNTTIKIPMKKFGWFAERNGSVDYDGLFNMNTGADDINKMGIIRTWNYDSSIPFYHNKCAEVNGTTGELWYPPEDRKTVKIFTADLCSNLELDYSEDVDMHGVSGHRYDLYDRNFDNGTKYPDMGCFIPDNVTQQLSGVRNVSQCKFGAPAFVSFAHFMNADPAFRNDIVGMEPDPNIHRMYLALEPNTGVPLKLRAILQLNLQMEPVDGIKILENVTRIVMPSFWFEESVDLTDSLASLVKLIVVLPDVGIYTGYGFIALSVLVVGIATIITLRKGWSPKSEKLPLS